MARAPWRKTGIAKRIHEEPVSGRMEERVARGVERAHPRVRALYESWGYRQLGVVQPFANSPQYDGMVRCLR